MGQCLRKLAASHVASRDVDRGCAMWLFAPGPRLTPPAPVTTWFALYLSYLPSPFSRPPNFHETRYFRLLPHASYIDGATMKVSVKYTITLDGLFKCPHEWDCRSLRFNSAQCPTCHILFSIVRLHFACRLEWSLHNLSKVGDHVHLLSTSDMFRDLLLESDNSDNDEDDPKTGHSLKLAIWSLWSPFEHPIVGDILKSAAFTFPLQVNIERSRPYYGMCE